MTGREAAHSLVDSVWFRLVSRGSMIVTPVLFSAILYLGWLWLDGRFDEQQRAIDGMSARVGTLEIAAAPIATRVTSLETTRVARDKQIDDINSRIERNQDAVAVKLDKIVDGMSAISNQVAGLAAVINSDRRP